MNCCKLKKRKVIITDNKAVLVTGASSGIGQAVAVHMSKLGYRIMLLARREERLKESLSDLEGDGHQYISFDLCKLNEIEIMMKLVMNRMGPLSGLVHCAGIAPMRPLNLLKPENLHEVMTINFYSYVELVRCFSKKGHFTPPSSIVAISSIAGIRGSKSKTAYSASKAAMDGATRCMAKELASKGIRINTVMPAWVKTEMMENSQGNLMLGDFFENSMKDQILGDIDSKDIAKIVAFLLSDNSSVMTGISLPADGGRLT